MRTPAYVSWAAMKQRCLNSKNPSYPQYGGRGIKVADEWLSFAAFLRDMGQRPEGRTIDRIDRNGDYTKENCRWATRIEQATNRSIVRLFEFNGERLTLSEWGRRLCVSQWTLRDRQRKGWPTEDLLTKPKIPNGSARRFHVIEVPMDIQ